MVCDKTVYDTVNLYARIMRLDNWIRMVGDNTIELLDLNETFVAISYNNVLD